MARLLVVDRSDLLAWIVAKLAPPETEVERVSDFGDAHHALANHPPDAVIFNLVPCHPMWRTLIDHCVGNGRLIPFFCTGEIEHFDVCNCTLPCRIEDFLPKDSSTVELADRIFSLIQECGEDGPKRFQPGREPWDQSPRFQPDLPTRES